MAVQDDSIVQISLGLRTVFLLEPPQAGFTLYELLHPAFPFFLLEALVLVLDVVNSIFFSLFVIIWLSSCYLIPSLRDD